MKKLFLFLAASTLALTSCSSDDSDGAPQSFTVTVNGTAKTFNTIVVDEEVEGEDVYLTVTALNPSNPNEFILFQTYEGDLGADAVYYFTYSSGGVTYNNYSGTSNFNIVLTQNSNNRMKGTFSGTLSGYNSNFEEISVTTTNGAFDFGYTAN